VRKFGQVVDFCPPPAVCVVGGTVDIETKTTTDDVDLRFMHVRRFRSLTYSLFGGVTETSGHVTRTFNPAPAVPFVGIDGVPQHWAYSFGAEAFPTTNLGVRVGYAWADYDSASNDSYGVAATWFFKRNIGIQLSWSRSQPHLDFATLPNDDTSSIRFIGRF
jgi:opacity protein-like surface antigen